MESFETIDVESVDRSSSINWRKIYKKMLQYAPMIIFIQALIIVVTLAFLLWQPTDHFTQQPNYHLLTTTRNTYSVFSNGKSDEKFLLNLVNGCNQRKHDLNYGIKCESMNISACIHQQSGATFLAKRRKRRQTQEPTLIATQIITSKAGLRFKVKHVEMRKITCGRFSDDCAFKTKLDVYSNSYRQEVIGFGGALTDSTINNILSLSTNGTKQLLDDYFGENGLKYNMIRITIGGSDFSSRFYTNDDLDSNSDETKTDFNMSRFKLQEEDTLYKIPLIKHIQREYQDVMWKEKKKLKLFASMWSPPVWMKTNNHFNKGYMKGSISPNLNVEYPDERFYKALATLKKKFLLAYQSNGIDFWGLTVMNEPIFAVQPFLNFNTMIFPPEDYANYIAKYLGPTILNETSLKHIKLIMLDDNRRFIVNFTEPVMKHKEVRKYISGISVHGYVDEDYHLMDVVYERYNKNTGLPHMFILSDELCSGHLPWMEKALIGNWDRGVHYALDIIRSLRHSSAGWVDWNMVLDTDGGPGWLGGRLDSPIIVDKANDVYYKSPMYYVLGHFSRYIPPGSKNVKTILFNSIYDYQLETVSFILPNKKELVTVVLNNNPYDIQLYIAQKDDKLNKFSNSLNETNYYQVDCIANSITTFIYPISIN